MQRVNEANLFQFDIVEMPVLSWLEQIEQRTKIFFSHVSFCDQELTDHKVSETEMKENLMGEHNSNRESKPLDSSA